AALNNGDAILMKAILCAAWAAVLFISSLPAAAEPREVRHVSVDYSDLDLTKPNGAKVLQRRVHGAIRQACYGPDFTLRDKADQRACTKQATQEAANDMSKL